MKKKKKRRSLMDQLTGIVLVVFAVGVLFMVGFVIKEKMPKKEEPVQTAATSGSSVSGSAADEEEVDERYLTIYRSAPSGVSKDYSGSVFSLELNEKDSTYKEYLLADGHKSEVDHGTFKRTDKGIETVNKNDLDNLLFFDGDYLISSNSMFDGKVPKGDTFDQTFVNDGGDSKNKVVIKFEKSGKFSQTILQSNASLDGSDAKNEAEGTYEKKKGFINRTKEDGTKMQPLYIYDGQICTSYYKLKSEAELTKN